MIAYHRSRWPRATLFNAFLDAAASQVYEVLRTRAPGVPPPPVLRDVSPLSYDLNGSRVAVVAAFQRAHPDAPAQPAAGDSTAYYDYETRALADEIRDWPTAPAVGPDLWVSALNRLRDIFLTWRDAGTVADVAEWARE